MGVKITVNSIQIDKLFDDLIDMPKEIMKSAYPFLKQKTPIRSGNARNKTKLSGLSIKSDYGYAQKLDDGWSKQAPKGFTEPTIANIEKDISAYINKVD
jgi:hypothetical protein